MLIFSTMDQNQRLNCSSLSAFSPVGWSTSLCLVCYSKKLMNFWTEADTEKRRSQQSSIPDSSLKEVKLMSIWTLTSPHPLTSSLKSSAVRSSRAFLGSTSSKPFLIAYERHRHTSSLMWIHILLTDKTFVCVPKNLTHFWDKAWRNTNYLGIHSQLRGRNIFKKFYLHGEAAQPPPAFCALHTSSRTRTRWEELLACWPHQTEAPPEPGRVRHQQTL